MCDDNIQKKIEERGFTCSKKDVVSVAMLV